MRCGEAACALISVSRGAWWRAPQCSGRWLEQHVPRRPPLARIYARGGAGRSEEGAGAHAGGGPGAGGSAGPGGGGAGTYYNCHGGTSTPGTDRAGQANTGGGGGSGGRPASPNCAGSNKFSNNIFIL